jgi:hypothetical protein
MFYSTTSSNHGCSAAHNKGREILDLSSIKKLNSQQI